MTSRAMLTAKLRERKNKMTSRATTELLGQLVPPEQRVQVLPERV